MQIKVRQTRREVGGGEGSGVIMSESADHTLAWLQTRHYLYFEMINEVNCNGANSYK